MADLNIKPNALFTADNLYVLNGMNSECIDLIYLDPPFNSKRLYKAPVGSKAAGAAFKDMWTWDDVDSALLVQLTEKHPQLVDYITSIDKSHGRAMMAYIAYMAQRLFEMHRVLKPTGSIYLHCDQTAGHYLKIMMDNIFGRKNFCNEIIWMYGLGGSSKRKYSRKHDTILFYGKSKDYFFNKPMMPSTSAMMDGKPKGMVDYWDIPAINNQAKERTGYPTQKPIALLNRIIRASSKEGDVVLDPFCGCATTCVSAQNHHRNWIGIDLSPTTEVLIGERLKENGALFKGFTHFTTLPDRRDLKRMSKREAKSNLYGDQQGNCAGCKGHFEAHHFEVDHRIPKSKGGGDFYENYQLLCPSCNRIKGNRPMSYLLMVIENRRAQRSVFGETPSSLRKI